MIDLHLLCYIPSPFGNAHWSILVPKQAASQRGTMINVRGDSINGFVHKFERGYIPSEDPEKPQFITKLGALGRRPCQAASNSGSWDRCSRLHRAGAAGFVDTCFGPASWEQRASKDVNLHSTLNDDITAVHLECHQANSIVLGLWQV